MSCERSSKVEPFSGPGKRPNTAIPRHVVTQKAGRHRKTLCRPALRMGLGRFELPTSRLSGSLPKPISEQSAREKAKTSDGSRNLHGLDPNNQQIAGLNCEQTGQPGKSGLTFSMGVLRENLIHLATVDFFTFGYRPWGSMIVGRMGFWPPTPASNHSWAARHLPPPLQATHLRQ